MTTLTFAVPGKPVPKQRARMGRGGHWFTPAPTRAYESTVRVYAMRACAEHRITTGRLWPLGARYEIDVLATWGDNRQRDLDNLLKSICDGGNGVLWADDSQIDGKRIRRTPAGKAPRAVVRVSVLEAA